ncbi:hypothetical protein FUA23_15340 [Neolewinella aurantiaca]|uniref:Uncharacterized protein n=1 Tax=Neolewinella aurantiaca TaxID=2602767 RepID=A0A5C7FLV5_9BACT|nr:hypothetical protein [Neolewinella aurantiaca]TXF88352.1 hypothetical protein FUA23_15340 [Neolewinella aurantiaca]
MSPHNHSTDNLLRRYISGTITAPEEAELERRALTDESLAQALTGLQAHPEADHGEHVEKMIARARSQVQRKAGGARIKPLRKNYARLAAAASVIVLFVVSALWFLPRLLDSGTEEMAMEAPKEIPSAAKPTVPATKEQVPPAAAPEPELAPPAPSSPARNPRSRPNEGVPTQADAQAEARARIEAEREQSARRKVAPKERVATTRKMEQADDAEIVEEMTFSADAPPAAPTVTTAPATLPEPSVAASQPVVLPTSQDVVSASSGGNAPSLELSTSGHITNENGYPVPGALVRFPGLPLGERTDSNGYFRLPFDATASLLAISHPDYEEETVNLNGRPESLQISLDRKDWQADNRPGLIQDGARSLIILDKKTGYAAPLEGYRSLRQRIEEGRPDDVPEGKVKFSFTVNTDGTLTDFEFRGKPDRATMDYIGETIVKTSVWEITQGKEPVRVYFKVVF